MQDRTQGFQVSIFEPSIKLKTVIRLYEDVITVIEDITNGEHPNIGLSSNFKNCRGAMNKEEVLGLGYYVVYRNFIESTKRKSETTIMNSKGDYEICSLVYYIYRLLYEYLTIELSPSETI